MNLDLSHFLKDDEIQLLQKAVFEKYGYDFKDYSEDSFKRRVNSILVKFRIPSFAELYHKVLNDSVFFNSFLEEVTVNVTEMFRDPEVFKTIRNEILPELATHPIIRIWHAGCSTGQEVYSMAILLHEAGLLGRSILYATDINQHVLNIAASGIYPLDVMKKYTENYINAGMLYDFTDYYVARYGKALFNEELKEKIVFSVHNLVNDKSFNEFNLIMCRNVIIYFNHTLQTRVFKLFVDSLAHKGFLALGDKENLIFSSVASLFEPVKIQHRIWRLKK